MESLRSKYSSVKNREELYRKELTAYIKETFEKHNYEFRYKCDTHATWEKCIEDENSEFDAVQDLPCRLLIGMDDDSIHEVYPYRIYQTHNLYGYTFVEIEGWDAVDDKLIKGYETGSDLESLAKIVEFINAVLEQK